MIDVIAQFEQHAAAVTRALAALDRRAIAAITEALVTVHARGGAVLICGNGGSAATALHMATDLGKGAHSGCPTGLRAFPLAANISVLTAWANDAGYERVFAEQVSVLGRPGDALVLLSASGASPNIVLAARRAREAGLLVIGFTGFGGGELATLAHHALVVPAHDYGVVEDVHLVINHAIAKAVRGAVLPGAEGTYAAGND